MNTARPKPRIPRAPWIAIHRYVGLVTLPLLLFAALTGVALVARQPIDRTLNADLFFQPAVKAARPVAPMVDRFAAAHPQWQVVSFPLAVGAGERIPVKVKPATPADPRGIDQLFLDRATGAVAGSRSSTAALTCRGFAEWLHDVHYTLLAGKWGRWLMGGVALLWFLSNLVGLYLTFPLRGPLWKQWKKSWRVSLKSVTARLMLDLHRASGLWLFVPLFFLALSSVALNFFTELYAPAIEAVFREPPPIAITTAKQPRPLDFAGAVRAAEAQAAARGIARKPAMVINAVADGRIGVMMSDNGVINYHALGPVYYYFDRPTHQLAEVVDPYRGNPGLGWMRAAYPIHSGRIGGAITILLILLGGVVTAAQCVTGLYLWLKRRHARIAPRKARNRQRKADAAK